MASDTATQTDVQTGTNFEPWQAGLIGGLVGGLVFGIMMTMEMRMIMENAIPGMYGLGPEAGAVGWVIHMSHSAVLGVVFAAIIVLAGLDERLDSGLQLGLAGLAYGVVLWVLLASFVMPAWVGAATPMEPPVPNWNTSSLLGHAVFGVLLGIVYAVFSR